MKHTLAFIIAIISFSASAQISVGLSAGIIAPYNSSNNKMKAFAGTSAAIELITPFYKGLKIRTGISFYSMNFQEDTTTHINKHYEVDNSSYYLAVPVGVRYIYDKKQLQPFIEVGVISMSKVGDVGVKTATQSILNPYITIGVKQSWENKMYFCVSLHGFAALSPMYNTGGSYYYNGLGGYLTLGYDF